MLETCHTGKDVDKDKFWARERWQKRPGKQRGETQKMRDREGEVRELGGAPLSE